jgi:hypothetical protein
VAEEVGEAAGQRNGPRNFSRYDGWSAAATGSRRGGMVEEVPAGLCYKLVPVFQPTLLRDKKKMEGRKNASLK